MHKPNKRDGLSNVKGVRGGKLHQTKNQSKVMRKDNQPPWLHTGGAHCGAKYWPLQAPPKNRQRPYFVEYEYDSYKVFRLESILWAKIGGTISLSLVHFFFNLKELKFQNRNIHENTKNILRKNKSAFIFIPSFNMQQNHFINSILLYYFGSLD